MKFCLLSFLVIFQLCITPIENSPLCRLFYWGTCVEYEEQYSDQGCNGGDSCCNSNNRCGEGEGDCDSNSDCNAGLLCGFNNCAGSGFDSTDDCCYNPSTRCNGGDSCCNSNNRCGEGEGDCDSNSDCNAGLLCGFNNCAGSGFDSTDDCCYNPSTTHKSADSKNEAHIWSFSGDGFNGTLKSETPLEPADFESFNTALNETFVALNETFGHFIDETLGFFKGAVDFFDDLGLIQHEKNQTTDIGNGYNDTLKLDTPLFETSFEPYNTDLNNTFDTPNATFGHFFNGPLDFLKGIFGGDNGYNDTLNSETPLDEGAFESFNTALKSEFDALNTTIGNLINGPLGLFKKAISNNTWNSETPLDEAGSETYNTALNSSFDALNTTFGNLFNEASDLFKGAFSSNGFNDTLISEAQVGEAGFESFNTTLNSTFYAANSTIMDLLDETWSLIKGAEEAVEDALVGLGFTKDEKNQTTNSLCPSNWLDAGEKGCFKFAEGAYTPTWQGAQDYCNDLGSDIWLAEINDEETQDLLSQHGKDLQRMAKNSNLDWWLGAVSSDKGEYGRLERPATQVEWKWARTGNPLNYTNWANDIESDYLRGGDCLQMLRHEGLDWDDVDCTDGGPENKPICQKFS